MGIVITNWFGRLGNNILQISSAIKKGLEKKANIILPYNEAFNTNSIILSENESENESGLYWDEYVSDDERMKICQNYILPIIKHTNVELDDNDLVIHLRGGDVFKDPPNRYVQAPPSYIKKVINLEKPKNIYVVYEDMSNPNLEFILKCYNSKPETLADESEAVESDCEFREEVTLLFFKKIKNRKKSF
jgi:hypothetical protein